MPAMFFRLLQGDQSKQFTHCFNTLNCQYLKDIQCCDKKKRKTPSILPNARKQSKMKLRECEISFSSYYLRWNIHWTGFLAERKFQCVLTPLVSSYWKCHLISHTHSLNILANMSGKRHSKGNIYVLLYKFFHYLLRKEKLEAIRFPVDQSKMLPFTIAIHLHQS